MERVVSVKFAQAGKLYDFAANNFEVKTNDKVVVETSRGTEIAIVTEPAHDVESVIEELKPILRLATEADLEKDKKNIEQAKKDISKVKELVEKLKLDMKICSIDYTLDGGKMIVNFTSEERVDFRDLIKELIVIFHRKIELRQIGARDDAKACGGLGVCGRVCCCGNHLVEFEKVSIKMAKTQNLSLNPTKISGLCGKLMCCLNYENDFYTKQTMKMPRVNSEITAPDGKGIVMYNNLLKEICTVKVYSSDGTYTIKEYELKDLAKGN